MTFDRNPTADDLTRIHSESHRRECSRLARSAQQHLTAAEAAMRELAPALRYPIELAHCEKLADKVYILNQALVTYSLAWSLDL